jgi:hypothetical protein
LTAAGPGLFFSDDWMGFGFTPARAERRLKSGPTDSGYPVGYWAYIADPDGDNLEVSLRLGSL